MMKTKYQIMLLFAVLFMNCNFWVSAQPPDRNVVWVHGLGGDQNSWSHYEQIFTQERKINSYRVLYSSSNGLDYCSNSVINNMDNYLQGGSLSSSNIAVAHSMGGLVSRNIDRLTPNGSKRFGGIVCVTTPNKGAHAATNVINGNFVMAMQDATYRLSIGPIASAFSSFWNPGGLLFFNAIEANVEFISQSLINNDVVLTLIGGDQSVVQELVPNSTKITQINSYPTTIPHINITALENSPVHWRFIGSNFIVKNPSLANNFNDQHFVDVINLVRGVYNTMFLVNQAMCLASILYLNPMAYIAHYRASRWKEGRDWFDRSETIWSLLIGAYKTTTVDIFFETYICDGYGGWFYPEENIPYDVFCQPVLNQVQGIVVQQTPSDGLLPNFSQVLDGIPEGNRYYIPGANHFEVRNMSLSPDGDWTRIRFNEIWGRNPGDFFRTLRRYEN